MAGPVEFHTTDVMISKANLKLVEDIKSSIAFVDTLIEYLVHAIDLPVNDPSQSGIKPVQPYEIELTVVVEKACALANVRAERQLKQSEITLRFSNSESFGPTVRAEREANKPVRSATLVLLKATQRLIGTLDNYLLPEWKERADLHVRSLENDPRSAPDFAAAGLTLVSSVSHPFNAAATETKGCSHRPNISLVQSGIYSEHTPPKYH